VFLIAAPGGLARFSFRRASRQSANSPDHVVSGVRNEEQRDPTKTMECA
jgi:hypothetical protein